MRNKSVVAFLCGLLFTSLFAYSLHAQGISKEEVLTKYELAITQAEELNLYQEDFLKLLPKIRLASKSLLRDDFIEADRILTEILSDLKLLESRQIKGFTGKIKLEWLEIYWEIIQKYALLALLAYLLASWPYFRGMLKTHQLTPFGKILLSILSSFFAILLSFFDLSRYGDTAWAFFDIQVVLLSATGLLGGLWPSVLSGLLVGAFRLILRPEGFIYAAVVVVAASLSGFLSDKIKKVPPGSRVTLGIGFLIGFGHGLAIYLQTAPLIPWIYVFLSVVFLALLEGAGVFIFLAVISGILREEARLETERELLKTQLLFLQAQMKPHFLFNALNTISAICGQEHAPHAQNLVLRLGDFLRGTLRQTDEFISLKEEIHFVDAYLEIERARYQDRLRIEKDFDIRPETWSAKIPLLILQPLVENAVRHGITKKESGGTLRFHLSDREGFLAVEIEDDGVGMDSPSVQRILQRKERSSKGLGIAIQNIHQRLIRLYGPSSGLHIESEPGQGTRVRIHLPISH